MTLRLCVACNGEVVYGEFVHDEDCVSADVEEVCNCPCHYGGFGIDGLIKQPCDDCDCVE